MVLNIIARKLQTSPREQWKPRGPEHVFRRLAGNMIPITIFEVNTFLSDTPRMSYSHPASLAIHVILLYYLKIILMLPKQYMYVV